MQICVPPSSFLARGGVWVSDQHKVQNSSPLQDGMSALAVLVFVYLYLHIVTLLLTLDTYNLSIADTLRTAVKYPD